MGYKFGMYYNNFALTESGLCEKPYSLDAIDMLLIDYISSQANLPEVDKIMLGKNVFFWLANNRILKDCGRGMFKTESAVKSRMLKLCKANVLFKHPDCVQLKRSYYSFGGNYKKLLFHMPKKQEIVQPDKILTGSENTRQNSNGLANLSPITRQNSNGSPVKILTSTRQNSNGEHITINNTTNKHTTLSSKGASSEEPKQLEMDLVKEKKITSSKKSKFNNDFRKSIVSLYNAFHIERAGVPIDWNTNKGEGRAMNLLIAQIVNAVKTENSTTDEIHDEAIGLFQIILNSWMLKDGKGKFVLNDFLRNNIKVTQINSQFSNILAAINNQQKHEQCNPVKNLEDRARKWAAV